MPPWARPHVAVVGPGEAAAATAAAAEEVGGRLAAGGAVVVCGGLGGVMEAVCRGAEASGGTTIGILPGDDRHEANPHVTIAVPTGMGEARNAILVHSVDVVVAIGGAFGTLSEIALALRLGKPVVGLSTWELSREGAPVEVIVRATDALDAARLALELAREVSG